MTDTFNSGSQGEKREESIEESPDYQKYEGWEGEEGRFIKTLEELVGPFKEGMNPDLATGFLGRQQGLLEKHMVAWGNECKEKEERKQKLVEEVFPFEKLEKLSGLMNFEGLREEFFMELPKFINDPRFEILKEYFRYEDEIEMSSRETDEGHFQGFYNPTRFKDIWLRSYQGRLFVMKIPKTNSLREILEKKLQESQKINTTEV